MERKNTTKKKKEEWIVKDLKVKSQNCLEPYIFHSE
jgi:hypothetical protein